MKGTTTLDHAKLATAFNLWMHRYVQHPEEFKREWEAITQFFAEKNEGKALSYGDNCAHYLMELMGEKDEQAVRSSA